MGGQFLVILGQDGEDFVADGCATIEQAKLSVLDFDRQRLENKRFTTYIYMLSPEGKRVSPYS